MQDLRSLHKYFTVGMTVPVIAGLLFGLIAWNVVSAGALTDLDIQIAQWLHARNTPALTQCLLILTNLHDPLVISPVAALITCILIWKKQWYATMVVVFVVQGGMLLNLLLKHLFQRARPSFENPLITLTTYSFPSGHVVASTVFYGALAVLLISRKHSPVRPVYLLLIALVMIMSVAFSRLYLGAHYLSDVVAGFLVGVAWLTLCLTAIAKLSACHEK